ncbi:hypothetical protein ACWF8U_03125 [Streptomyces olivaceus]|uniref:hypothetical protein n=1 Tax=Streptomyces olivaceus TaxID=47716 RepID=UPI001CCF1E4F|nr:hypothetical protein [Streptomyces olivaceus]
MDKEFAGSGASGDVSRSVWVTLRNTAENGLAGGALEFFLRTELREGTALAPASLLISWLPMPRGLAPPAEVFAEELSERRSSDHSADADVDVVDMPAGRTVRVCTATTLDHHVRIPGDAGYLHLAFSLPLSGTKSSMGNLCDAMAQSLRWVPGR